jgi:hypothetical protein
VYRDGEQIRHAAPNLKPGGRATAAAAGGGEIGMKYTGDTDLPPVTDERLQEALRTVQPYTIVILRPGPGFPIPGTDRDAGVTRTIWEHGKRNFALRLAGLMPIVCPVADGSDVIGVAVLNASTEDVDRIMRHDPGVQDGLFTYEIHPTRTFPGSGLPAPEAAVEPDSNA